MALTDRLELLITANGTGAIREFRKVGDEADKQLGRAQSSTDKLGGTLTSVGAGMVGFAAIAGSALWSASQATSDLNEQVSQSQQIFGDSASEIDAFGDTAAESIGQSDRAAHEAANTFGLFFTNAGKSREEAAKMSITMATLASDMASFKNTTPEEAVEALGAALRGEMEPIRKYGVMLDDATLRQQALDMGLVQTTKETLPPAVKMQAAYAAILEQTSTIQGDFARTADGAANKQRIMAAQMEDAKASIGEGFLPVMSTVIGVMGGAATAFAGFNDATGGAVSTMLAWTTVAVGGAGAAAMIAGQIIKMRDTFMSAVAAMRASQIGLLGFTGAALGLGAALWVWQDFEKALKNAETAAAGLNDEVMAAVEEGGYDAARDKYEALTGQIEELDKTIGNSKAPWDADYRKELSEFRNGLAGTADDLAAYINLSDQLAASTGMNSEEARVWLDAMSAAGQTFTDAGEAAAAYKAGLGPLSAAQQSAADATANHEESTKKLLDTQRAAIDPFFATIDALRANEEANRAVAEAQLELITATNEHGASSLEAMEARDRLTESEINAGKSALSLDEAQRRLKAAMDDGKVTTEQAKGMLDQWVSSGTISQSTADALAWKMFGLAGAVNSIPTAHHTDATLNIADVEAKMARLKILFQSSSAQLGIDKLYEGRAVGGPVNAGQVYMVGEKGPELFVSKSAGQIIPAGPTAKMTKGGSGRPIHIHIGNKVISKILRDEELSFR